MQDSHKSTGPRAFAQAMLAHWFSAMSGPLSVPAAIAAAFVQNQTGQMLLVLTAFVCVWAAAYGMWRAEREQTISSGVWFLANFVEKREKFTIAEAACLLANAEIKQSDLSGPSAGYLYDIKRRILSGSIRPLNAGKHELEHAKALQNATAFGFKPPELRNDLEIDKSELAELAKAFGVQIPRVRA